MSGKRYADEFKIETVKQVTEHRNGCCVANVEPSDFLKGIRRMSTRSSQSRPLPYCRLLRQALPR